MGIHIGDSHANAQLSTLTPMAAHAVPIGPDEWRLRIQRAQAMMRDRRIAALYIHAGANLTYFTGITWWPSERMVGAILPAEGPMEYILPAFERGTFEGMMAIEGPMHCWHENESPYPLLARVLSNRNSQRIRTGMDPSAPFFLYDGLRQTAPDMEIVNGASITVACRSRKSATELALMQCANNMTLAVQRATARILRVGISVQEVQQFIHDAHKAVGAAQGSDFCIVLFGEDTAYPHGVKTPKTLQANDMVLIDTGCNLYGYRSDITRSYVFGQASARQRTIWEHEKATQAVAFDAARIGQPCAHVDEAVRSFIASLGYGTGYALPGVPHRTGHGIGLEIHESPYLVLGDQTLLDAGMCFSVEPMICIPGEFGIRHEDHIYMTDTGPRWFTTPALSIDDPFGNMQ